MYPVAISDYYAPSTVSECLDLLVRFKDEAKIVAGGQSILPLLKLRLIRPDVLIDINRISELQELGERRVAAERVLRIGSLTKHRALASHPLISSRYPILADAAKKIGDVHVRNRGTIGGSVVHGDPAADLPVAVLALGGNMRLVSVSGQRAVSAQEFFQGIMTTDVRPDELLVSIDIPAPSGQTGTAYTKYSAVHGDFAIVSIGAAVTLVGNVCETARIYLGGIGDRPQRAASAEKALVGREVTTPVLQEVSDRVSSDTEMGEDDIRASAQYRRVLAGHYAHEVLTRCVERAQAGEGMP